jgi:hypothetical protein
MNTSTRRIFFGAALILLGGLFLVQQLLHLQFHVGAVIVAMVFALAGLAFIYVLTNNTRDNWWAAIPGMVLLGLGVLIATSEFFPSFANYFGGSLFLGFIGLAFLVVLLMRHEAWWAVIPAGVLFTLAAVAGISTRFGNGLVSGSLFFLGIGLTFAIIGLMPVGRSEKWPWIPAGICLVFGTLLMIGSGAMLNTVFGFIWPAILVLVGGFLIFRSTVAKKE